VFVVTPKGDVINLPAGATVIDFAYAIHTAVGNRMIGAKVDGRIVPIDYVVKNGEIVEVLTTNQQGRGPARDWLNIAKTSEARTKIRAWFKKERREENIAEGKLLLEREVRTNFIGLNDEQRQQIYDHFTQVYHCQSLDDFFASVGYGGILVSRLLPRIREYYNIHLKNTKAATRQPVVTPHKQNKRTYEGVEVEGIDNCLIRFSNCCGPLPGDDIIGFVTRGHGVSIHKRDCSNVPKDISACEHPDRWIAAKWTSNVGSKSFKATLFIAGLDRPSIIADISLALTGMRVPMHAINARATKDGNCEIILTISAEGTEHLNNIIARILKINDVITVDRTGN
jgi:GTP pyrophosphokinase